MISLLRDDDAGLPDDFLIARIRGRRQARLSRLSGQRPSVTDSDLAGEEAITRAFETEVRWLYRQTTGKTRMEVAPLFVLFELRLLLNWLRQGHWHGEQHAHGFLGETLWHQSLPRQWAGLDADRDGRNILAALEKRAAARVPAFKGVSLAYQRHNLTEVERRLTEAVLAHGAVSGKAPLRQGLCRALIDGCNVTALMKAWLWRAPAMPAVMPAGHLSAAQLGRIWRGESVARAGLPATASKAAITAQQIAALQAEQKKTIWRTVRPQAMEFGPAAVVIDYLFFLEAEVVERRGLLGLP